MSAAPKGARALTVVGAPTSPRATPGPAARPALLRRVAVRLGDEWLPHAAWTISRTGRPGLAGIGLLLATALFLLSTHLKVSAEVETLRADLAAAQRQPRAVVADKDKAAAPVTAMSALPARTDMPAMLHQLFDEVARARLAIDTAKYDVHTLSSSGVVRYQIGFPVTGPYPQVRAFIDSTLAKMPAVALSDLVLERRSIGSGSVDAQIRMTVHTAATGTVDPPAAGLATAVAARGASDRVVTPTYAAALFAQHSWYVSPPPRPPPPPPPAPPPPEPTAPAFPYTFVGRYSAGGDVPVFSLARGDRVFDARVGDRLDGIYQFESATDGELVFVYLPLKVRQTLAIGATK